MGKPLCYSCANAIIMRGAAGRQERVLCEAVYPHTELTFLPDQCSSYGRIASLDLTFMQEIAWTVKKDNRDRFMGFVPPTRKEEA